MSRRTINLIAVAGAVAVIVWVLSGVVAGSGAADLSPSEPPSTPSPTRTPSPVLDSEADPKVAAWRGYALAIPEVEGLPTDLLPGDALQLWVAWDPPVTKKPKIAPLVDRVLYERTILPTLPGEAPVAVVLVQEGKVDELMYGDRYGSLSAVVMDK